MAAAYASVLESVQALLAAGASVDLRNEHGHTALFYSVWCGACNPYVVAALLDAGADVNAQDNDGETALHTLVMYEDLEPTSASAVGVAILLLQRGANACAVTNDGRTPAQFFSEDQQGGQLHSLLLGAAAAQFAVAAPLEL